MKVDFICWKTIWINLEYCSRIDVRVDAVSMTLLCFHCSFTLYLLYIKMCWWVFECVTSHAYWMVYQFEFVENISFLSRKPVLIALLYYVHRISLTLIKVDRNECNEMIHSYLTISTCLSAKCYVFLNLCKQSIAAPLI